MNISNKDCEGITVVSFEGNLDTSTSSDAESEISQLLQSGVKDLIFDLSQTDYVSSSGLRVFLSTAKKIAKTGGKLILCSPNEVVMEILSISGFNTIIPVQEDIDSALSEF